MLRNKALTLICGLSWVDQRIDKLQRARHYAEESLRLGDELEWGRNTAFCHKCLGRLLRMEAEVERDATKRSTLLRESLVYLERAIPFFEALKNEPDLGPDCEDVGECLSLLGRTYLIARDILSSRRAVEAAYQILDQFRGRKAWADLLILDGELNLAEGVPETALDRSDAVLRALGEGDSQLSEIKARAFLLRARAHDAMQNLDLAAGTFGQAAEQYDKLNDAAKAYRGRWQEMKLRDRLDKGAIPHDLRSALQKQGDAGVCVEMVRLYSQDIGSRPTAGARAQRAGPSKAYLQALLRRARIEVRRREVDWE